MANPQPPQRRRVIGLFILSGLFSLFFGLAGAGVFPQLRLSSDIVYGAFAGLLLLTLLLIAVRRYLAARRRAELRLTHPGFRGAPPLWAYASTEPTAELPQYSFNEHPRCCSIYWYSLCCRSCAAADLAVAARGGDTAAWTPRCWSALLLRACEGDRPTMDDYAAVARLHGVQVADSELRSFPLLWTCAPQWINRAVHVTVALMQIDAAEGGGLLSGMEKGDGMV